MSSFYCRVRTGEITSDPEYKKAVDELWKMSIPESEKRKLMLDHPCEHQCEDCLNIVIETKAANKLKYGW